MRFGPQQEGLIWISNRKQQWSTICGISRRARECDRPFKPGGPLRDYCLGLVMPCERKSVEPMAAVTAPDRTAAQHQSLLHFVGQRRALPAFPRAAHS